MVSQYNTISTKDISCIYDMYDNVYPIARIIKQYDRISLDKIQNLLNDANKRVMPITWTAISQNFTSGTLYSICYGDGKFVAVSDSGEIGYSTDGITWTAISQDFTTYTIYSVCYGDGKFVAVGHNGRMGYSTDGINWTAISQDFTTSSIYSICYGNGKFIAGDSHGKMAYSQTGLAS